MTINCQLIEKVNKSVENNIKMTHMHVNFTKMKKTNIKYFLFTIKFYNICFTLTEKIHKHF